MNVTIRIPIGVHRPLRTPQIYIYGKAGVGKSHIVLSEPDHDPPIIGMTEAIPYFRYYLMQTNGNMVNYRDHDYHMIVWEEFQMHQPKEHMNLQILNTLLSGEPTTMWQMHGHVEKKQNLPVLILSNLHPKQAIYPVAPEVERAFLSRLKVYRMHHPVSVRWVPKPKPRHPNLVVPHPLDYTWAEKQQLLQSEEDEEEEEEPDEENLLLNRWLQQVRR